MECRSESVALRVPRGAAQSLGGYADDPLPRKALRLVALRLSELLESAFHLRRVHRDSRRFLSALLVRVAAMGGNQRRRARTFCGRRRMVGTCGRLSLWRRDRTARRTPRAEEHSPQALIHLWPASSYGQM